jgi:1-acyl-sn-glycerol-3-phosphate acyltransferase
MAKSLDRFFDGTFGGNEQNNEIPPTVAHFFSGLFHFLCRLFWRYEVVNQERLRAFMGKRSGAVLVAPHVSYVDVIILFLTARPKQWVRLMGRDNLFSALGGLLGEVIARVGAFPVTRDSADRTAVKRAAKNETVVITDNNDQHYLFCSEEVFDRRLRQEAEEAAYAARMARGIRRAKESISRGEFVVGAEAAIAEAQRLRKHG